MAGYSTVLLVRELENNCDALGLMLCYPRYQYGDEEHGTRVAIKPKDANSWPIYDRDCEIFTGTIEELKVFLLGLSWAREYDTRIGLSTVAKRERKEQDIRNRQLAELLKNGNGKTVDK